MRTLTLSVAYGVRQQPKNRTYSTHATIENMDDLREAVQYDHICGLFKDDKRKTANFISTDCLFMDVDNTHSENSADWLIPEGLPKKMPDVELWIAYSRNNGRDKTEKDEQGNERIVSSARPRFHVYFPLSETVDNARRIRELKEQLLRFIPDFDKAAKDTARLSYGVETPQVTHYEGSLCIDEFITISGTDTPVPNDSVPTSDVADLDTSESINVGERHNALLKTAFDALSRYNETKAREIFDKACARCKPPKPYDEVVRIWEYCVAHVREFKEKQHKKVLTLRIVEDTLKEFGISAKFNVITKDAEISGLPENSEFVPAAYYSLDPYAKKRMAVQILPVFLLSYFKSKKYSVNNAFINDALASITGSNPRNPVLDMLNDTSWDGRDRLAEIYEALGIDDSTYSQTLLRKWLHQAIALALNDDGSINAEFVLVLQGPQGAGKTQFFRKLAVYPELFKEGTSIDMRNKDSRIEATSVWIDECGELDSTLKREQADLKAFFTASGDIYRKPYARKAEKVERRTCFCATVNPEQVIRDDTGSRRYVFIHVNDIDKQFVFETMTPDWCIQLWRQVYETYYAELGRHAFFLTESERAANEKNNAQFTVPLEGETEILDILDWSAPYEDWCFRSASEIKCMSRSLDRIDTRKVGRALAKVIREKMGSISDQFKDQFKRVLHGRTEFFVPPCVKRAIYRAFDEKMVQLTNDE